MFEPSAVMNDSVTN